MNVKFGKVQFPTKLYGQFLYPAGEYQAILITLGSGEGANWWCVLYPPLCFLDFSNGVAVSDGFEEKKAKAATKRKVAVKPVDKRVEKVKKEASLVRNRKSLRLKWKVSSSEQTRLRSREKETSSGGLERSVRW